MPKTREAIPKGLRDQVLREFNHRCAICGADRPQLHHLDQDPSHNEASNLIPLCPNCHLTDQHNPTSSIPMPILQLFRQHRDPVLLSPQFRPLHARLTFLDFIADDSDPAELEAAGRELTSFVYSLRMGLFYGQQIEEMLNRRVPGGVHSLSGVPSPETARAHAEHRLKYRAQLRSARDRVFALAVELLRYQDWPPGPVPRNST